MTPSQLRKLSMHWDLGSSKSYSPLSRVRTSLKVMQIRFSISLDLTTFIFFLLLFTKLPRVYKKCIDKETDAVIFFFCSRSLLDGGLHGDHDPEHLVSGPGLRLGNQPVQSGSLDDGRLHRDDVQLDVLGLLVRQVRKEAGFATLR